MRVASDHALLVAPARSSCVPVRSVVFSPYYALWPRPPALLYQSRRPSAVSGVRYCPAPPTTPLRHGPARRPALRRCSCRAVSGPDRLAPLTHRPVLVCIVLWRLCCLSADANCFGVCDGRCQRAPRPWLLVSVASVSQRRPVTRTSPPPPSSRHPADVTNRECLLTGGRAPAPVLCWTQAWQCV